MSLLVILISLSLLIYAAYRGFSVILFAPVAAILAVIFTFPGESIYVFSSVYMEKLSEFIKLYFPVFLLGALFGKLIQMSGFASSLTKSIMSTLGPERAIIGVVVTGALLTYCGISLFVVSFAIYPFAAEVFRYANIPKKLLPGTIALGAFTFTMDALPGTPQIQNLIPTTFFHTDAWAAPWLGIIGSIYIFTVGIIYLNYQRKRYSASQEEYATGHVNGIVPATVLKTPSPLLSVLPLLVVAVLNKVVNQFFLHPSGNFHFSSIGISGVPPVDLARMRGLWSVEYALVGGIMVIFVTAFHKIKHEFNQNIHASISGALLATMNTASEYGYGATIAALPGFKWLTNAMSDITDNTLMQVAITTSAMVAATGSASGGLSITLAAAGNTYLTEATKNGISPEVLHRVAAMASGGLDTLPHNGAVITLLLITGLTHRQAYKHIFAMTLIKTSAVFLIILIYYLTGIV